MTGPGTLLERVLTPGRVRRIAIVVIAVNVVLYAVVIARGRFPFDGMGAVVLPDFLAHLTAARLVEHGQQALLYDVHAQSEVQRAITHDPGFLDLYLSPPLASVIYAMFGPLKYWAAAAAWTLVSLALLLASARRIRQLMPGTPSADVSLLLLATFASQPIIQLLGSGQDTAVSLWIATTGTAFALARNDAAAGLVLSLGLFKPQLFVMPPLVFAAMRRGKALEAWATGAVLQVALTLAIFRLPVVKAWWAILHSPEYASFLRGERGVRMSSLMPLLESIVPPGARGIGTLAGAVLAVAIAAAALSRIARASRAGTLDERGAWALAWVTTLLVSPHLFDYDLAMLVLPLALLVELRGERGLSAATKGALFVIVALGWTVAARAGLWAAPWPLRVLAASWVALPMLYLWREVPLARSADVPS
jgi:hypothetical protein